MTTSLPRSKVTKNQTWNAESVFSSPKKFDAEIKSLLESLVPIKKYQGHLGDSLDIFIEAMDAIEAISKRAAKVQVLSLIHICMGGSHHRHPAKK